jgi:arylsulfatase A-like enzyme
MTGQRQQVWRNGHVEAVLIVITATVGALLPIDFLLAVDGYLAFLRPAELIPVWGWAWVYYACFGFVGGLLAVFAAKVLAIFLRRDSATLAVGVALWSALSLIAVALIRAAKLWIGIHSVGVDKWLERNQYWMAAFVLLACAVAARRDFAERRLIQRMLTLVAAGGLAVTIVSPLFCKFSGMTAGAPQFRRETMSSTNGHPDIILVTADAFAANHASFLGYGRPTTPNLEVLAKGSTAFAHYYANSNFTTASVNSFINGVRPWTHRANQFLARVTAEIADAGLVARLKREGYQTDVVWTNSLAAPFLNRSDRWLDVSAFAQTHYSGPIISSVMCTRFAHFIPVTELGAFVTTVKIIDHLAIFLGIWSLRDQNALEPAFAEARTLIGNRDPSRPLFLWVHVMRPHSPYAAPAPFLGRFTKGPMMRTRYDSSPIDQFFGSKADDERVEQFAGRYDESVEYFDASVGEFVDWLKEHGAFEKSLLVVSSDHGESFHHRYGAHAGPMLYEDLIHVPLLIKEPGQTAGKIVETQAEQIDLMPTLLDLAGVPVEGPIEGRSLRPAMNGEEMVGPVFSMNFEQNPRYKPLTTGSIAMIAGRWKYVRYLGQLRGPLFPKLTDSLYDLRADPDENSNLASVETAVAAQMRSAIDEQLRLHDRTPQ